MLWLTLDREGRALQKMLGELRDEVQRSGSEIETTVFGLSQSIGEHSRSATRHSLAMGCFTFVLAAATVVMAWATVELAKATRAANRAVGLELEEARNE